MNKASLKLVMRHHQLLKKGGTRSQMGSYGKGGLREEGILDVHQQGFKNHPVRVLWFQSTDD